MSLGINKQTCIVHVLCIKRVLVLDIKIFELELTVIIINKNTVSVTLFDLELLYIDGQESTVRTLFLSKWSRLVDLALDTFFKSLALCLTCRTFLTILTSIVLVIRIEATTFSTDTLSSAGTHFARLRVHACVVRVPTFTCGTSPVAIAFADPAVTGPMVGSRTNLAFRSIAREVIAFTELAVDSFFKGLLVTLTDPTSTNPSSGAGLGVFVSVAGKFIPGRIRFLGITFTFPSISIAITRAYTTFIGSISMRTL